MMFGNPSLKDIKERENQRKIRLTRNFDEHGTSLDRSRRPESCYSSYRSKETTRRDVERFKGLELPNPNLRSIAELSEDNSQRESLRHQHKETKMRKDLNSFSIGNKTQSLDLKKKSLESRESSLKL
ncbi:expressed protein [Phakopsora pachyrhizi]|uniref:Expressed protein n=1 Tax=Phakopsora pachyrhizi TaxID=170000 RepID=A0AAV0B9Z1_PHAPC|nr:expressed protein [Phakopsora pachyrhizi]